MTYSISKSLHLKARAVHSKHLLWAIISNTWSSWKIQNLRTYLREWVWIFGVEPRILCWHSLFLPDTIFIIRESCLNILLRAEPPINSDFFLSPRGISSNNIGIFSNQCVQFYVWSSPSCCIKQVPVVPSYIRSPWP